MDWLLYLLVIAVVIGLAMLFYRIGRAADPRSHLAQARTQFQARRLELQAAFFLAASNSGKPRGLRWLECQWDDVVEFACDLEHRQLIALAGVTIRFEAIEGGDMEGLPAVANLRNASAVFVFIQGNWQTQGRAVFNLNPGEVISHFGQQYERLA